MEDIRLPPLGNVARLLVGQVAVDHRGKVEDLKGRLLESGDPVAFLICRGGDLENEASKLELLSSCCRDLAALDHGEAEAVDLAEQAGAGVEPAKATKKRLQVVLLVSTEATEETLRAALQRLPAASGDSLGQGSEDADAGASRAPEPGVSGAETPSGSPLPPNPQPAWISVACVPSEADLFGDMIAQRQEMLVLLLDVLSSATGGLALFSPTSGRSQGQGLPREGQVVLQTHGAPKAWPFSLERIQELELSAGLTPAAGRQHDFKNLFVFPPETAQGQACLLETHAQGAAGLDRGANVESLSGFSVVALYFGAGWCDPCAPFSEKLDQAVKDVRESRGPSAMQVVFVSFDPDDTAFADTLTSLPAGWLALPYACACASRDKLSQLFGVRGIPSLVLLHGDGALISSAGRDLVSELGASGFPYTPARVTQAREEQLQQRQKLKREQDLRTLICPPNSDELVLGDGSRVQLSGLTAQDKLLGLYFSTFDSSFANSFSKTLEAAYSSMKASGVAFEIVMVAMDTQKEAFDEELKSCPWPALPFAGTAKEVKRRQELRSLFDSVKGLPALVVLDEQGRVRTEAGVEKINELGANAFPFA